MAALVVLARPAQSAPLESGTAHKEITPPVGYRMAGYFFERFSTGVHDPLLAKAVVLRQADAECALVFCDLVGISPEVAGLARERAEMQTGIPAASILIAATHAHTGPAYTGVLRDQYHRAAIDSQGSDPHEALDYSARLAEQIVEAIREAHDHRHPATLSAGFAEEPSLSFNRRFHMRDGRVVFNPGKLNPEIVRSAGPIDPQVGLLLLRNAKTGEPVACLSVFALHLDTVGGTEYSADFPKYLAQLLQRELGPGCLSAFGAGTCGDINHVDVRTKDPQHGFSEAERIGTALAKTIAGRLNSLPSVQSPRLASSSRRVSVPMKDYSDQQIEEAKRLLPKVGARELSFLEEVEACNRLAIASRGGKELSLEVQVFRLSDDVALVGLPGEVFVEIGLDIKRRSPFATTIVIELCNDDCAYLPTRKAFAEGSYETVNSLIQPGGGEALADSAVEQLKRLKGAP